jgi:hypothetical protein
MQEDHIFISRPGSCHPHGVRETLCHPARLDTGAVSAYQFKKGIGMCTVGRIRAEGEAAGDRQVRTKPYSLREEGMGTAC